MAESSSIEERTQRKAEREAKLEAAREEGRQQVRGGRLRAAAKAMRDQLIVQRVAEHWSWAMIADEAGISARQCQRVAEDYRGMPSPLDIDATALIEELARGYRQSVGTFSALAATADNTAAAVGAVKGANDAREKLISLLQAIGHVPHDLGTLRVQRDVQQLALRMLDGVEAFERGEIGAGELAAVFYEMAGIPRELPVGAADS